MQTKDIHDRAERLVRNEVNVCLSSLVSTLAQGSVRPAANDPTVRNDLIDLVYQAQELCAPVLDYEEAARYEGWKGPFTDKYGATYFTNALSPQGEPNKNTTWACRDWQELGVAFDIEPYEREIFEHWSVSQSLANDLQELGERVDMDFAGMCVWGRTTTGQGIAQDSVIRDVLALHDKRLQALTLEDRVNAKMRDLARALQA